MKQKNNTSSLLGFIAVVLLGISLVLVVRTSYARYSTAITNDIGFKASLSPGVYLIQEDDSLGRVEFNPEWQSIGGEKCVSFFLSNFGLDEDTAPNQDMTVRIRVFVPESVSEDANEDVAALANIGTLAFSLHIGENPVSYSSKIDYLGEQTPMYIENIKNTSGTTQIRGGWVYSFCTAALQEVYVTLPGGELVDIPVTITVADVNTDTSDFVICVDRIK